MREIWISTSNDVAAVFAHPSSRFATAIVLADSWPSITPQHVVNLLTIAPTTIRRLAFGDPDQAHWSNDREVIDLDPVLAALPNLEHLFTRARARFTRPSKLHSLELAVDRETLGFVGAAVLPELERLALHLRADRYLAAPDGHAVTIEDLRPLLSCPPPALTTLELFEVEFGDALISELAQSPLLRQIRTLRLWNSGLTVVGGRAITRSAFGHLTLLDLSDPGLSDETIALVVDACLEVRTISPRLRAIVRPSQ